MREKNYDCREPGRYSFNMIPNPNRDQEGQNPALSTWACDECGGLLSIDDIAMSDSYCAKPKAHWEIVISKKTELGLGEIWFHEPLFLRDCVRGDSCSYQVS